MKAHFQGFARYNQWANDRLYQAVEPLTDQELNQDLMGFFGSLLGTLNHILVGDLIWMQRLDHQGSAPERLDQILYNNLPDLLEARRQADDRLGRLVDNLEPNGFQAVLTYRNVAGQEHSDPVSGILTHMFNHQTHHRGQCHQMLSQLGKAPPPLDIIYYVRSLTA